MQYYKIVGNLPLRFVVEMGLGACIEEWMPLAERLVEQSAGQPGCSGGVLLYERYGINRSPATENVRTPKHIAQELHQLLAQIEHTEKVILIAHSQGGLYAPQYARLFPEQVGGILLLDPLSARDYLFKEKLSPKQYTKSGVDKSGNLILMKKLAKMKMGWLVKKMMKNAPPFYYFKNFSSEAENAILNSYTNITHLDTAYQEYVLAHDKKEIQALESREGFPDIPLTLITHDSEFAIKESMQFGNNPREFAEEVENMWQDIMKEYLTFSKTTKYIQAKSSGHYIHLSDMETVIAETLLLSAE
ncbi:MAG: alpha/beta fold hydrolase [Lachnospiraceae bacterium]